MPTLGAQRCPLKIGAALVFDYRERAEARLHRCPLTGSSWLGLVRVSSNPNIHEHPLV